MSTLSARMKGIVEVNNKQMALAKTMIDEVNDMAITLRTLTLMSEFKEVDTQVKILEKLAQTYLGTERELANALSNSGAGATERELLTKI